MGLQIKGKNPAKQLHPQMVAHVLGKPFSDTDVKGADRSLQKHCGAISKRTEGKCQKHAVFRPSGSKETADFGDGAFSIRNAVNIDAENLRKKKRQCRFSRKDQRKSQESSPGFSESVLSSLPAIPDFSSLPPCRSVIKRSFIRLRDASSLRHKCRSLSVVRRMSACLYKQACPSMRPPSGLITQKIPPGSAFNSFPVSILIPAGCERNHEIDYS